MKGLISQIAKRYVAGETADEALEVVAALNAKGISATVDNLGENVATESQARSAAAGYTALLDAIEARGLDSGVSLKLTHMGLDLSRKCALECTAAVVEHASRSGNFVRIDMESGRYTERTVEMLLELQKNHTNVGLAIQSCLRRSAGDIKEMIERGVSVRLVKGAYKEPPEIAFEEKAEVDENFSTLMRDLLLKGYRPAIATHDEELINEARDFAEKHAIPMERFEFQMLLGIKRKLQIRLVEEGYRVRVYVPYGPDCIPYMMRRLTERKENLYFVLKSIAD